MHARVTHFRILPGRLPEFQAAVDSVLPLLQKQKGFRALLVLHTSEGAKPEVTNISLWESFEDLKNSEKNMFLYQALSRVLSFCEGFPSIREHEVLISDFAADSSKTLGR
jgi:heme-degrading monooxygenase HmoA